MKTRLAFSAILAATLVAVGCSSQQLYGAGQAWQKNECFKINDQQERSRCLASTSTTYEQYKRESQPSSVAK